MGGTQLTSPDIENKLAVIHRWKCLLGNSREVPRPRRVAWRRQACWQWPWLWSKSSLIPLWTWLWPSLTMVLQQAATAKGWRGATPIHAPVNRAANLRPSCRPKAALWCGPRPTLRQPGVTIASPRTRQLLCLPPVAGLLTSVPAVYPEVYLWLGSRPDLSWFRSNGWHKTHLSEPLGECQLTSVLTADPEAALWPYSNPTLPCSQRQCCPPRDLVGTCSAIWWAPQPSMTLVTGPPTADLDWHHD